MDAAIKAVSDCFPERSFLGYEGNVYAALALLLVGIICGGLGGLVVGNRMAFFSDALAHCAFAGIALGFLICILAGVPDDRFREWITTVMVVFGVVIGLLIAWVRQQTGLASDTVIGVFFALAVGLGAVFSKLIVQHRRFLSVESFIFGDTTSVRPSDIVALAALAAATAAFLIAFYNQMLLTCIHPSLALSRRVPVVALRYVLIVLLGLTVNLCLQVVGVLLINGLLIVPAAAAANLSRNLRQHFWWTLALTIGCGLGGQILCWEVNNRLHLQFGVGGVIVVLAAVCFFASMAIGPLLRGRGTPA